MSGSRSSYDETDVGWQLASSPGRDSPRAGGSSSYLKTVVRQQQDATKTCRLLALEVGSLKAELAREQKKRAQAVNMATMAEATQQQAEQRLQELQYSNNKLQQEVDVAHKASEANSRRVNSLRLSLADAEAEAQDMKAKGQQQIQDLALLASTLQALVTACCCNTHCSSSSSNAGAHLATQLTRGLLEALIHLDRQLAGTPTNNSDSGSGSTPSQSCAVDVTSLIQQAKQFVKQQQQQQQGWSCRQAPGSPGATAAAAGPAHLQQQQLESVRLQHLAERTAWEGERLQLQQDRARLQLQLATMQQQRTASDSQLHAEAAAVSQQLNASRDEVAQLRAALSRQQLQGSCSPKAQPWQQQQQRDLAEARAEVAELRAALAQQEVVKQQQRQQQSVAESAAQRVDAMTSRLAHTSLRHDGPHDVTGRAAFDAAAAAARVAVTAMRFGQGASSSSRGDASGSPQSCRPAAAAADTAAAGGVHRLSPARTRFEQSRACGSAGQPSSSTAVGVEARASAFGNGSARRSLAFQAAAGGSAAGVEDIRGARSQGTTAYVYTSPMGPVAVNRNASSTAAAAATGAGEGDRYEQLVREADAALQQLAACRHKADSAGVPAAAAAPAAAAPGGPYTNRLGLQQKGQSAAYFPGRLCGQSTAAYTAVTAPRSHTTHHVRPHSASMASPLKSRWGLSDGCQGISSSEGRVYGGNRSEAVGGRVGVSHLRASCSPSFSRQLLAGCQPGNSFDGNTGSGSGGNTVGTGSGVNTIPAKMSPAWSPSRRRLGSPGQATAGAAVTDGLQGELQALDQDIAAAEASLQAAVIRLGAAAGQS